MQETKTLTISNPPQFGVITESKDSDLNHSIFKDVYDEAFKRAADIIKANSNCNDQKERSSHEEFSNTVISFVGKRGSGKSTAMCSFSSFLNGNDFDIIEDKDTNKTISSKHFYCLDAIDSVQLGTKETIIGRISAAMFKEYENITSRATSISVEQKRDFIKQVNTVNKYAVMYHNGEWFKQNDSLLVDTYHVSSLRCEMQKLVEAYLMLKSKSFDIKDKYLVVSIDDLDMGIENSYAIMEEIRKFLCIKNIIVLVSLRMDQVHIALRSKFEQQLNSKKEHTDNEILIDDLAYRYIEKLFPYSRQIQMPTLSLNSLKTWEADFDVELPSENEKTILSSVLHLIWKKTLIIPVCNSDGEHFLVPRNLRSLCNFVVFLRNLPDISADDPEKQKNELQSNLCAFSKYLVSNVRSYEREYVSGEDLTFSEMLISIINNIEFTPLEKINSRIVGEILYFLKNNESNSHYRKLFDKNPNVSENDLFYFGEILLNASLENRCISLGDLIYVLGEIDSKTRCRYIKYLIEVIRMLWSAKMTEEYYCSILIASNNSKPILSPRFIKSVGKLIVNPDVGFFEKSCSDFTKQMPNSTIRVLEINDLFKVYAGTINDQNWRYKTNIPFTSITQTRTNEKYKTNTGICCHPLRAITAFLDEDNSQLTRIKDEKYKTEQTPPRIPLPLYSFDFIYRYVELLSDILVEKNVKECREIKNFKSLMDCLIYAVQNITGSHRSASTLDFEVFVPLNHYIPKKELTQIIVNMLDFKEVVFGIIPIITDQNVFFDKVKNARTVNSVLLLLKHVDSYNIPGHKKEELKLILEKHKNTKIELKQLKDKIMEIKDN